MDYEVLNRGMSNGTTIRSVDGACVSFDAGCPSVNIVCPDFGCGGGNTDSNCSNVFPCENPGFGCRTGCGGARGTNCAVDQSL